MEYQNIEQVRERIYTFLNSAKLLPSSRYMSLVITDTQKAYSWAGLCLKYDGQKTPYFNNSDPSTGDKVDPPSGWHDGSFEQEWKDLSLIRKIKDFRNKIEQLIQDGEELQKKLTQFNGSKSLYYYTCLEQVWISLHNTRIWLGWELGEQGRKQQIDNSLTQPPVQHKPEIGVGDQRPCFPTTDKTDATEPNKADN